MKHQLKLKFTDRILKLSKSNPLAELAWEMHNNGFTTQDVDSLLQNVDLFALPDPFKVAIVNAMRDIESSGKVLEKIRLPA